MQDQPVQPLSEKEFAKLDRFLLSDRCPETAMTMDSLHGFLTAIAIGPQTVPQEEWLPMVWDSEENNPPERPQFHDAREEREIVELIERSLEEIKSTFTYAPEDYQPLFCMRPWKGENLFDAEPWAWGFWLGMGLRLDAWEPIWKSDHATLMRPFYLMGCEQLSEEEMQLVSDPHKRHKLAIEMETNVMDVYKFWASQTSLS